jgi:tRNA 2-selenouridine synthase
VASYGQLAPEFLIACTQKIGKRLGPKLTQETIVAIQNKDLVAFVENVLYYYDKTYHTGLLKKKDRAQVLYSFDNYNASQIAKFLLEEINKNGRN